MGGGFTKCQLENAKSFIQRGEEDDFLLIESAENGTIAWSEIASFVEREASKSTISLKDIAKFVGSKRGFNSTGEISDLFLPAQVVEMAGKILCAERNDDESELGTGNPSQVLLYFVIVACLWKAFKNCRDGDIDIASSESTIDKKKMAEEFFMCQMESIGQNVDVGWAHTNIASMKQSVCCFLKNLTKKISQGKRRAVQNERVERGCQLDEESDMEFKRFASIDSENVDISVMSPINSNASIIVRSNSIPLSVPPLERAKSAETMSQLCNSNINLPVNPLPPDGTKPITMTLAEWKNMHTKNHKERKLLLQDNYNSKAFMHVDSANIKRDSYSIGPELLSEALVIKPLACSPVSKNITSPHFTCKKNQWRKNKVSKSPLWKPRYSLRSKKTKRISTVRTIKL